MELEGWKQIKTLPIQESIALLFGILYPCEYSGNVSGISTKCNLGSWHLVWRPLFIDDLKSSKCCDLLLLSCPTLDISDIKFVINFDFPSCSEDYVHRIGRTARSDRTGTSYTFFTTGNAKQAKDLISILKEANQHVNPKLMSLAEQAKGMFGRGRNRYRDKNAQSSSGGGSFNRSSYGDSRGDSRSGGGNRSGGPSSFSGRGGSGRGGHSNRGHGDKGGYGGRNHSQQNGSWSQQSNMIGGGGYNNYSTYSQQPPPPPPPGPPPSQPNPPQPLMQPGQQQQQYTQQAPAYPQASYQAYQPQATNAVQGQIQQAAAWSYNRPT